MLEKINHHYSFTNPATIHDEEALTALELAGRTASKVNEIVHDQNELRKEPEDRLTEMENVQIPKDVKEEVQEQIDNGTFDRAISQYAGGLDEQMETIIGAVNLGSVTTMDTEVINLRNSFLDYTQKPTARSAINEGFSYVPFPMDAVSSGTYDLNDLEFCRVKTRAYTYGCTLLNAPYGFQLSMTGENRMVYIKTEPFGKERFMLDMEQCPEIKQTLYTYTFDKAYTRFGRWNDGAKCFDFSEWKPVTAFYNYHSFSDAKDLNQIVEEDRYIIANTDSTNVPPIGNGFLLKVSAIGHGWLIQDAYGLHNNPCHYFRIANCPSQTRKNFDSNIEITWSEWKQTHTTDMQDHEDVLKSGVNINQIVEPKTYTIGVTNSIGKPSEIKNGYLLQVVSFNKGWLIQYATPIYPNNETYFRTGQNTNIQIATNFANGLSVNWSDWKKVSTGEDVEKAIETAIQGISVDKLNSGMKVVLLGDSIFAECQDNTSVASYIEKYTGATVYNCAFGGSRLTGHQNSEKWKAFDFENVCYCIQNENFSSMEEAIENDTTNELPTYFRDTVNRLKSIDWNEIDITIINHGTNDFYSDDYLEWGMNFDGALYYLLECEQIGRTRIIWTLPCYRHDADLEGSTFEIDGEGLDFRTYVNKLKEVITNGDALHDNACRYWFVGGIPFVDPLNEMGIGVGNWHKFLKEDEVHLNENGRKALAKLISNKLRGM